MIDPIVEEARQRTPHEECCLAGQVLVLILGGFVDLPHCAVVIMNPRVHLKVVPTIVTERILLIVFRLNAGIKPCLPGKDSLVHRVLVPQNLCLLP